MRLRLRWKASVWRCESFRGRCCGPATSGAFEGLRAHAGGLVSDAVLSLHSGRKIIGFRGEIDNSFQLAKVDGRGPLSDRRSNWTRVQFLGPPHLSRAALRKLKRSLAFRGISTIRARRAV